MTDGDMTKLIAAIVLVNSDEMAGDPVGLDAVSDAYDRTEHDPSMPAATFDVDGTTVSAVYSASPMKPETLEQAIEAARIWPEACEATKAASGHLVIASDSTAADHETATKVSLAVSRLAAKFIQKSGALAVFWPESGSLVAADLFAGSAAEADALPTGLVGTWVHITWYRADPEEEGGPARFAAATMGLARFVGREVDFAASNLQASEIAERILFVSKYLMTEGPVFQDGDTLGYDETAAFRVALVDEGYRPGIPAYVPV